MTTKPSPLRIGYVPEHFSTPLYYAQKYFGTFSPLPNPYLLIQFSILTLLLSFPTGLEAQLIPFPSGTGHMITSLRSKEIDIGIGLTEGWVAGLGKGDVEGDGGYRIVGTYVDTPLCTSSPISYKTAYISSTKLIRNLHSNRLGNFHRLPTHRHQLHTRFERW